MRPPVRITTPVPTVWEVAEWMHVPKKRVRELIQLANELSGDGKLPEKEYVSRKRRRSKRKSGARRR